MQNRTKKIGGSRLARDPWAQIIASRWAGTRAVSYIGWTRQPVLCTMEVSTTTQLVHRLSLVSSDGRLQVSAWIIICKRCHPDDRSNSVLCLASSRMVQ